MARPRVLGKILGFEGIEFKIHYWPSWGCINSLKLIRNQLWNKNKKNLVPHKVVLGLINKMDHKALNQLEGKSLGLYSILTMF